MDLTDSIAPKSDQLNAEDLLAGPRTVTIAEVRPGSAEQPVDIHLVEFPGRPFRPSKTVRRILVAAWGKESAPWPGRRLTLYRDPDVQFGGVDVGGIRVSHLSHIAAPLKLALSVKRGKRAPFDVQPLVEAPKPTLEDALERARKARTKGELRHFYRVADGLGMDEATAAELVALAETLPETEVTA